VVSLSVPIHPTIKDPLLSLRGLPTGAPPPGVRHMLPCQFSAFSCLGLHFKHGRAPPGLHGALGQFLRSISPRSKGCTTHVAGRRPEGSVPVHGLAMSLMCSCGHRVRRGAWTGSGAWQGHCRADPTWKQKKGATRWSRSSARNGGTGTSNMFRPYLSCAARHLAAMPWPVALMYVPNVSCSRSGQRRPQRVSSCAAARGFGGVCADAAAL